MLDKEYDCRFRKVEELRGPWRFQIDQDNLGESEGWFPRDFNRDEWSEVVVPGAWDFYDQALWAYEGIGWYSTEIPAESVDKDKWQRLFFTRVNIHAKVWLNGQFLGEHVGGHLPFEFAATPFLSADSRNALAVRVDNVPRIEWLPGARAIEWVLYGGILQPVLLLTTASVYISDLKIIATPERQGAILTCEVQVTNSGFTEFCGMVTFRIPSICSSSIGGAEIVCKPRAKTVASTIVNMPYAERWSPESPVLYEVFAQLEDEEKIIDEVSERFGVRTIEARGAQILLNGKPVRIKGVNRYDEYARFGPTVPEDVMRKELMRIKKLGVNLVRVHYPQDPALLRIMDEIGLLFMEETSLCWWNPSQEKQECNKAVIDAAEKTLEDMIRRDGNHPCVIIWSMANECATDTDIGIEAMRRLMRKARELDPTRLVTFVIAGDPEGHKAVDEADFIADNIYFGLFRGIVHHIYEFDSLVRSPSEEHLRKIREEHPDKPLVVTEFGTHGISGLRGDARFTEDYQAAYVRAVWRAMSNVPDVAGGVLWCWADYHHRRNYIGYGGKMLQSPYGPYGVVTIDRRAKKSLFELARMYGGEVASQ